VKVVVAVVALVLKTIWESGTVRVIVPLFGPLGTTSTIDWFVNEIVCPPDGTVELSLSTELNQVKLLALMLVPLKFDAIELVVVQAAVALVGTANNAKSKIVGKITSETRYRASKMGNLLECWKRSS
jgi:hypothetical protein